MEISERIRHFRRKKGLNQRRFAEQLRYSYGYIADLERGRQKPSREFLERMKEVFGVSSAYILEGNVFYLWSEKVDGIEEKMKSKKIPSSVIREIQSEVMSALTLMAEGKYQEGYERGLVACEPEVQYRALPTSTKKLLESVREILESGNEVMINALKANIKAFLSAVRNKNEDENKGGD